MIQRSIGYFCHPTLQQSFSSRCSTTVQWSHTREMLMRPTRGRDARRARQACLLGPPAARLPVDSSTLAGPRQVSHGRGEDPPSSPAWQDSSNHSLTNRNEAASRQRATLHSADGWVELTSVQCVDQRLYLGTGWNYFQRMLLTVFNALHRRRSELSGSMTGEVLTNRGERQGWSCGWGMGWWKSV